MSPETAILSKINTSQDSVDKGKWFSGLLEITTVLNHTLVYGSMSMIKDPDKYTRYTKSPNTPLTDI